MKVSIIMLAYNKLEYTKLAVDSLYKYTPNINFDFISVNNGSSDGTEEYFNSLPNSKKINFKNNVGGDKAFNEALKLADGEYTVFLNNDIILTASWLENLINVMESNKKIGVVVPTCNSSSNYQTTPLYYTNTTMLQEAAKAFNISNPNKWEEKLRLMLYVAIFRTNELKDLGGLDEIYSPGGFDDDDLTCRYRRAGYKLILARDTYIHHYGSMTIGESYSKILGRNREIFKNKLGYDSWEANAIDFQVINKIEYNFSSKVNLLGVGNTCAANLLQIKNQLKSNNITTENLDYFSFTEKYLIDLKSICDSVYFGNENYIYATTEGKKYNFIFWEEPINSEYMLGKALNEIYNISDTGCKIIICLRRKTSSNEFVGVNEKSIDNFIINNNFKRIIEESFTDKYIYVYLEK